jgi:sortase A
MLIPKDPQFSIVIPKSEAKAKILANIEAADEKIYLAALNKGIAHTLGTAFPWGGHIILCSLNRLFFECGRFNAIFIF